MSVKPIDKRNALESRDAVWSIIRKYRQFSIRDLVDETHLGEDTVRDYVAGLTAAGYLERQQQMGNGRNAGYRYTLQRDCGVDAPRVRRDGSEVTQGRGREQMWNTMRILKEFSPRDLAFHASTKDVPVSVIDAKHYIHYLHAANYLVLVKECRKTGSQARYSLLNSSWTGPRPPQIQRVHQLYDPNLKRVVWSNAGGEE